MIPVDLMVPVDPMVLADPMVPVGPMPPVDPMVYGYRLPPPPKQPENSRGTAVPVGVGTLPPPCIGAHVFEAALCLPRQQGFRQRRVGVHGLNVSRSPRHNLLRINRKSRTNRGNKKRPCVCVCQCVLVGVSVCVCVGEREIKRVGVLARKFIYTYMCVCVCVRVLSRIHSRCHYAQYQLFSLQATNVTARSNGPPRF